jgi:hypothetical protein
MSMGRRQPAGQRPPQLSTVDIITCSAVVQPAFDLLAQSGGYGFVRGCEAYAHAGAPLRFSARVPGFDDNRPPLRRSSHLIGLIGTSILRQPRKLLTREAPHNRE